MKPTFLILPILVLSAACVDHYLPCRSVAGLWGEEKVTLEISFAETVCDPGSETSIRFSDVIDGRCPKDYFCIWAGEVRPRLDIVRGENVIGGVELSLHTQQEVEIDQQTFIFTLAAITPTPPPDEVKKSEYRITLEIARK